ncbi:glycoside hydrolase 43 family protein [Mucilaginibacter sp. cycad4]|uniref:glycoside hydrolase family 43 protein n=1 Tax=Mucilaginibacter sp. cycad4 TaxID=3342096 RepID=UPI002AAB003F|nr:glycoside hydrolase 43 family protein [Mucilaginibacter gossypii]WPV01942.1 glycoside hydrolase 43 family protein [Mucilaginibacter gossypii]
MRHITYKLLANCLLTFFIHISCEAQYTGSRQAGWGDQRDGTFRNPILNADYSDPDVIRVGKKFYMVCSDFHFMGMQVLESTDLVNWHLISQIYRSLLIDSSYDAMSRYGSGSWAPSIRFHDHKYFVFFCTPDEGLYMSSADDPAGPWSPLTEVQRVKGWEDPCPFWDDDGQAYLGHSKVGAGPIIIHKMTSDGKRLLDSGKTVYTGKAAEGTKIYKRNGLMYLIIPEGGVGNGFETALRANNIYGPYERKIVLERGKTKINGPHQGGMVELESGESWFIHFQNVGAIGRICHLEPVQWKDDWPFIGKDLDGNGVGEPVTINRKPVVSLPGKITAPATTDDFNGKSLGLQWQWNHNPVDANWSLSQKKGFLSLHAMGGADTKHARNTITQKLMGNQGEITTLLNTSQMAPGQKAGLCLFGNYLHEIGLLKTDSIIQLYTENRGIKTAGPVLRQANIYLRISIDVDGDHTSLQYSLDGRNFTKLGVNCELSRFNSWKGMRPALYSYNTLGDGGVALFDWFKYRYDGPGGN